MRSEKKQPNNQNHGREVRRGARSVLDSCFWIRKRGALLPPVAAVARRGEVAVDGAGAEGAELLPLRTGLRFERLDLAAVVVHARGADGAHAIGDAADVVDEVLLFDVVQGESSGVSVQ